MSAVRTATTANQAFEETLRDVLDTGLLMQAAESQSIGSQKSFQEIHDYHLVVEDPQQRLQKLVGRPRPFNLIGAIARFVWIMGANNRLADIEYYWGAKVKSFSDDNIIVPGSSYGARMFNSHPGINQVKAIIKRLRDDATTRRAAVSIYQPIDAVRESKDIPCTFGLLYHIRAGKLVSTVIMRSNNALALLPYNLFEFSLLAEVIAREVSVPLGHMCYDAVSMHVYENDLVGAQEILSAADGQDAASFPPMPAEPSPMQQVQQLVRLEARLRHVAAGLTTDSINEWLKPIIMLDGEEIQLHEYWRQFYYLLLYYMVANKTTDRAALQKVAALIEEPYKSYLTPLVRETAPRLSMLGRQQDLFGVSNENTDYLAYNLYSSRLKSLEALCNEHNDIIGGKVIDFQQYIKLRNVLVGDTTQLVNLAARNHSPHVSKEEFLQELAKLT